MYGAVNTQVKQILEALEDHDLLIMSRQFVWGNKFVGKRGYSVIDYACVCYDLIEYNTHLKVLSFPWMSRHMSFALTVSMTITNDED